MKIVKKGFIKVPTQPKDYSLQATGLVFKSYDNQIALELHIAKQDGKPADLLGANVRLLMNIYEEVDGVVTKDPVPFIASNLITESYLNGVVKYILPDSLKAYNGTVETFVYVDYPDNSSSDNIGFTFRMEKSKIDKIASGKAEYFIQDFKALLAEVNLQVDEFSANVTELQNEVKTIGNEVKAIENEVKSLTKLQALYSNSLDFGDYDYSGNPNLIANINADSFSQGTGALSVVDDGDEVVVTLDPNHKLEAFKVKSQPALLTGKTYTMSVEIMLEDDFTGDPSKIGLRYIKMPNWVSELYTRNTLTAAKGVWQKLTGTVKITAASDNAESWLIMLQNKDANNSLSGKLRLRHAKLEEGSTATPFQPNLLAEPYNMCREYPNENIVNPTVKFPIKTSNNPISGFDISEELIIGETYTVSLKGTKPANKEFHLYYGDANYQQSQSQYQATLLPVEGLANVWSATFTARNTSETTNLLRVALWQKPNSATYNTAQIDWIKIEKGDTRTPNIEHHRYKGLALLGTAEPTKYEWGLSLQGEEEDLNAAKAHTDKQVQTVTTAANSYTDTAKTEAINSANEYANARKTEAVAEANAQAQNKVTALENKLTAISHLELNITNGNTGSCHLYRQGKIVTLYFQNLCGKNSGGVNSKIADLPEGSFPPVTFEQLVGSTDRSTLNSAAIEITSSGAIYWKRNTSFGSGYTFIVTYVLG